MVSIDPTSSVIPPVAHNHPISGNRVSLFFDRIAKWMSYRVRYPIESCKASSAFYGGMCRWLSDFTDRVSWLQIAGMYLLTGILAAMPFVLRYFIENKAQTGKKYSVHADDLSTMSMMLLAFSFPLIGLIMVCKPGYAAPAWSQFSTVPNDFVAWMGLGLAAAQLFLANWSAFSIGHMYSPFVSLQKGHKMVTRGAYQYLRHPMYIALALIPIATLLIAQNWLLALTFVPPAVFAFARIKQEETLLIEIFGQKYVNYKHRVHLFGPIVALNRLYDGLTDKEVQAALKLYEARQAGEGSSSGENVSAKEKIGDVSGSSIPTTTSSVAGSTVPSTGKRGGVRTK